MCRFSVIAITIILAGCTVKPEVTYKYIDTLNYDTNLTDSFSLASSKITIQSKKNTDGTISYTINTAPEDYPKFKIGVISKENIWKDTMLSIAKIDNSDRVKEIGVETTDNRIKAFNEISSVIVATIPLVSLMLDKNIYTDTRKETNYSNEKSITTMILNNEKTTKLQIDKYTYAVISLGSQPFNSIKAENLKDGKTLASLKNSFIYSSCTNATVKIIRNAKNEIPINKTVSVRVNDPRYIQFVAFPSKGMITTHTQCGESVKTDTNSTSSDAAVVAAVLTDINNIKNEIDKNKEAISK